MMARLGTSFHDGMPHNRWIAFTSGYITWAALLYVSLGPLAASHLSKGSLNPTHHLTLNVLIPAVLEWTFDHPSVGRADRRGTIERLRSLGYVK
jgi:hypothetical protein